MYYREISEDNKNDYEETKVDSKIFYRLKSRENIPIKKKRRYSDLLKDPLFAQQDLFRKLNMIKQFRDKNGDMPKVIDQWKSLIGECIIIMQKDYEVSAQEIFKIFQLENYGFSLDQYE
jgi:hypothetical protein